MYRKTTAHKKRKKVSGKVGAAKVGSRRRAPVRRRRVSGSGDLQGMLEVAGGLILGSVAARELNTVIVKQFPGFSPLLSGLVQAGAGFVIPMMVKAPFAQYIGYGMVANGGMVAIVSTGLISGLNNESVSYRINGGTSRLPVVTGRRSIVSGTSNLPVVSGPDYRVNNPPGGKMGNMRNMG